MSLGVLNNLSAMSAANNLNNTQNSLSKTLQQMSSGSKINSGADDAAGLSLVNGLQANSTALAQSQTNATEGVGLLQVADGALSQVTNLLNRAVTLATEVSNGTLNGSQQAAANQEYQSILSEISNIGTTTTYNQRQVFNSKTDIYTGDSSTAGASIDSLTINALSASNLGDTNGVMSYSTSQSSGNVFIDLGGAATHNGALAAGANQVTFDTLSSSGTTVSKVVTVATGGSADDLIAAINNAGLGVTASFTTAEVAGDATGAGHKGIMITGSIGKGTAPSTASYAGSLTTGSAADTDNLGGSITFQVGSGPAQTVTMAQVAAYSGGTTTISDLSDYITDATGLNVLVTDNSGKLDFSSAPGSTSALNVTSNLTDTTTGTTMKYTSTPAYNVGVDALNSKISNVLATVDVGTASSSTGIATISYSASSGQNLSGTNLSTQTAAQSVLTQLNAAISNVAAQDGYIGAQINTLNAVSNVISTQQQNIVAAQNAVQATDYAAASSAMSKFQILSQTGIAALAQANSTAQLVTKLLQ